MLELADEWDLPMLTNSYISVYSRPGCATTLPLDTCRPVPDEVAHAEVEALEHKYGKEYTSYATHVLQQLERGESPYLLKASDLPAGQVKVPHGSTGRAS